MKRSEVVSLIQYGHTSISNLLFDYYAKLGLNEIEMVILLHIHRFIEDNDPFPTPKEIASRMSISTEECTSRLRSLIQKGYLSMEQNKKDDIVFESYQLDPLYERIVQEVMAPPETTQKEAEGHLYELFEKEFSRPLSPMECETINVWLDQDKYSPELIKEALYETVLSGKLNLRYMDRILFEWHRNGITTAKQAKTHRERFRKKQEVERQEKPKDAIPKYPNINWLDES